MCCCTGAAPGQGEGNECTHIPRRPVAALPTLLPGRPRPFPCALPLPSLPRRQVIGALDGSGRVVLKDREAPAGTPTPVDLDLEKVLGDMPNKTFRCGWGGGAGAGGRWGVPQPSLLRSRCGAPLVPSVLPVEVPFSGAGWCLARHQNPPCTPSPSPSCCAAPPRPAPPLTCPACTAAAAAAGLIARRSPPRTWRCRRAPARRRRWTACCACPLSAPSASSPPRCAGR